MTSRLSQLVSGRTVGVLLHGKSLMHIQPATLRPLPWVWASLNHFAAVEGPVLYGGQLDIVLITSEEEIGNRLDDVTEFLARRPRNLFITTRSALAATDTRDLLRQHRNQIILVQKPVPVHVPALGRAVYPNSAMLLLTALMANGAACIVTFGMDGCAIGSQAKQRATYFNQATFDAPNRSTGVTRDTVMFNHHWPELYRESGSPCPVHNCSAGSLITCIPYIHQSQLSHLP